MKIRSAKRRINSVEIKLSWLDKIDEQVWEFWAGFKSVSYGALNRLAYWTTRIIIIGVVIFFSGCAMNDLMHYM
jgi:hypothetical protein